MVAILDVLEGAGLPVGLEMERDGVAPARGMEVFIRRVIQRGGRSRTYVNGALTGLDEKVPTPLSGALRQAVRSAMYAMRDPETGGNGWAGGGIGAAHASAETEPVEAHR